MGPACVRPATALAVLRAAFALFAGGSTLGGIWDFAWHTQTPFESFASPPHLLMYTTAASAVALLAILMLDPTLRGAFEGGATDPRAARWAVLRGAPPCLMVAAAGMYAVLLSGALDLAWHGAWGIDETRWSAPHAMFGWGLLLASLGFWSARVNLRGAPPAGPAEAAAFAFFAASFAYYAVLLPYAVYPTAAAVAGVAALPAVEASPGAGHTFRIYETIGVSHFSAAYLLLTAAWAGVAVGIVRTIDPRPRVLLAAALAFCAVAAGLAYSLALLLGLPPDWTFWWPAPLWAFAMALVWREPRVNRLEAGSAPAVALVALLALPWVAAAPPVDAQGSALLLGSAVGGVALAVLGPKAGAGLGHILRHPHDEDGRRLLLVVGLAPPAAFGALDLFLRWSIP